jgi:murein DD-endopeptidase MepM/ murein hydrolase activator NlpD
MKRGYTVIIFSPGGEAPKQFFISRKRIIFLSIILGFFLTLIIGALIFIGPVYSKAIKARILEREVIRLKKENEKVKILARRVEEIENLRKKVAEMLGVNLSPPPFDFTSLSQREREEIKRELSSIDTSIKFSPAIKPLLVEAIRGERFIPSFKPVEGVISRSFSLEHKGIDIVAPLEAPVFASADGVVIEARYDTVFGNRLVIDHNGEYRTVYGHLQRFNVKPGQTVERGELIGFVGSTGRSTGPHLHFEIWKGKVPQDPLFYISK